VLFTVIELSTVNLARKTCQLHFWRYPLVMGRDRTRRCETLASELREVATGLVARLRASSADSLPMSQSSALAHLINVGPMTVADLARAEHVKPQSTGVTVALLEEEGLVKREMDPSDGRRMHVLITDKGKRLFLAGRTARQAWLSQALQEHLSDAEQKRLLHALSLLRKTLER
jgi:DNA-binding MarR family transcriptional regulator